MLFIVKYDLLIAFIGFSSSLLIINVSGIIFPFMKESKTKGTDRRFISKIANVFVSGAE